MTAVPIVTRDVEVAASALRDGAIVVYPTETFYGLGALASHREAIERLARAKLRPEGKPLPLVAADAASALALWASPSDRARRLAAAFWPGPLTIVAPAVAGLPSLLALDGQVAVRVPGAALARELCRAAGGPVVSTSANPSGGPPPDAVDALDPALLARVDVVLDGGRTPGGLPSTVVGLGPDGPRLLRDGVVPWADVERVLRSPLPSRGG